MRSRVASPRSGRPTASSRTPQSTVSAEAPAPRTLNVAHVVHFPVFGGPHNQALRLAGPLAARGFTTVVVLPDGPGNAADRLRSAGVDVRRLPLHRLRATLDLRTHIGFMLSLPAEVWRLRKFIRDEHIDIVQIGGLVNPHAAIAARLEGIPVVWQLLDTRAPRPLAIAAMALVRSVADVVMSTGTVVAEAHPGYHAIADRLVPFFPPVDLERYAPHPDRRAAVRASWGLPEASVVVGCIANINRQKGIVELINAFAAARAEQTDARLVLVGAEYSNHADYSDAVRAQMNMHGLAEGRDVVFAGERDDVEIQLAGMDLIALAAAPRSEGITTAILEGMAAGLPVVATDVGGIREVVENGRTGFLVPSGNARGFAEALSRLIANPEQRVSMGREARRVATRFGVDASAAAHVRAYAQALAAHASRAPTPRVTAPTADPIPSRAGRVIDGIPVFLSDPDRASHDEMDHGHGSAQKQAQAHHFDRLGEEAFEIARPHGTPRLYRFLLGEKFRRGVAPIRSRLRGATALTVCGGSGMDAEFLARAGAVVTSSDLSLGAALRASERSERYGIHIRSIVADVEQLPYADRSFDLVAVHDGLHHLRDPFAGLSEMARVAGRWVVVTEPARASATRLAIRLGLALETEEAGNRVMRMEPSEVAAFLETRGFATLRAERYAMYYPHRPGTVTGLLSHPIIFPIARVGWQVANVVVGRFGNKMVVIAERKDQAR